MKTLLTLEEISSHLEKTLPDYYIWYDEKRMKIIVYLVEKKSNGFLKIQRLFERIVKAKFSRTWHTKMLTLTLEGNILEIYRPGSFSFQLANQAATELKVVTNYKVIVTEPPMDYAFSH